MLHGNAVSSPAPGSQRLRMQQCTINVVSDAATRTTVALHRKEIGIGRGPWLHITHVFSVAVSEDP